MLGHRVGLGWAMRSGGVCRAERRGGLTWQQFQGHQQRGEKKAKGAQVHALVLPDKHSAGRVDVWASLPRNTVDGLGVCGCVCVGRFIGTYLKRGHAYSDKWRYL